MRRSDLRRILLALLCVVAACRRGGSETVTIATTPDLASTGIVQMLARRFADESKMRTNVIVTEETLIPDLVHRRIVDAVVTVSPQLGRTLQRSGSVRLEHTIGYDDYLLVGPKADPARAKSARTAAEAMRRIARRDRAFCSPADVPELRDREAAIWKASPSRPEDNRRYRSCNGSALDVLKEASRRNAYTLTDRATLVAARRDNELVPLLQGTPLLHNDLMIFLVAKAGDGNPEWFVEWTMSYRGRDLVERYRWEGHRRFFVRGE